MNQIEFLKLYRQEKPIFQAWGEYLAKVINEELQSLNIDIRDFLKINVVVIVLGICSCIVMLITDKNMLNIARKFILHKELK